MYWDVVTTESKKLVSINRSPAPGPNNNVSIEPNREIQFGLDNFDYLKSSLTPFLVPLSVSWITMSRNYFSERSESVAGGWAMMGSPPGLMLTSASIIMVSPSMASYRACKAGQDLTCIVGIGLTW